VDEKAIAGCLNTRISLRGFQTEPSNGQGKA
jgi:hypothetical protein